MRTCTCHTPRTAQHSMQSQSVKYSTALYQTQKYSAMHNSSLKVTLLPSFSLCISASLLCRVPTPFCASFHLPFIPAPSPRHPHLTTCQRLGISTSKQCH